MSLDENSNNSSVTSATVSRKKRPSNLKLTGQTSPQPPSLAATASTSTKGPCLQTDIDAVYRSCSPLSLPRPSPIASDFELSILERFDQILATLGTSSGWLLPSYPTDIDALTALSRLLPATCLAIFLVFFLSIQSFLKNFKNSICYSL